MDESHLPPVILTIIPLVLIPVSYSLWLSRQPGCPWQWAALPVSSAMVCIPKKGRRQPGYDYGGQHE